MTPETSEAVKRLRVAAEHGAIAHEQAKVLVSVDDLNALLADMPCASCVIVETCKGQAAQIHRQWDEIAKLRGHD